MQLQEQVEALQQDKLEDKEQVCINNYGNIYMGQIFQDGYCVKNWSLFVQLWALITPTLPKDWSKSRYILIPPWRVESENIFQLGLRYLYNCQFICQFVYNEAHKFILSGVSPQYK